MTQHEVAARMRIAMMQRGGPNLFADWLSLIGYAFILAGAAWLGWKLGCWWFIRFHG